MDSKIYLVALHFIWISQKKLSTIFESNKNYKEFYENLAYKTLRNYFKDDEIDRILSKKEKINLSQIEKKLQDRGVDIIEINDEKYPKLLKEISNPPYLLYVRWKIDNSPKIAVIWSRKMTSYWEKAIEKIIPWILKYFTIVSWWAMWCDSKAHIETINSNWKTISVIWTWIDVDYPVWNMKMYDEIVKKDWAVISIFPLLEPWNAYNFPIRNEIISWLSSGVLVIEAQEKSGTLITVNLALEQGKDIFAVPGDIFKANSLWCNNLIKNGNAKMTISENDIFEEYNISIKNESVKHIKLDFWNEIEKIIYETLLLESFSVDDLMIKLDLKLSEISVNLSMLEIRWIIQKNIDWKYGIN